MIDYFRKLMIVGKVTKEWQTRQSHYNSVPTTTDVRTKTTISIQYICQTHWTYSRL